MRAFSTVTITDSERVVWTGSYKAFQAEHIDRLSVSEWCILWDKGALMTSRLGAERLCVQLHSVNAFTNQ